MESTIQRYENEMTDLKEKRKEIIREAKKQAEQIIQESNAIVEKTIREIKEAQAEKTRTRKVRQEMDEFRARLEEEQRHEHDEMIERKIRQIQERRKRKAERKEQKKNEAPVSATASTTQATPAKAVPQALQKGDSVRLKGQTTVGVIEETDGKKAIVTFGNIRTTVQVSKLERAKNTGKDKPQATVVSFVSRETQNQVREKHLNFHQDIDVRGMRGDEALQVVTHFIDDAILVGAGRVRILHGTGTGALRQLIRQYLNTVSGVTSAHDEHVQFGGAGITVVELA